MGSKLVRRLITIPAYLAAGVLWFCALPVWLPLAVMLDLVWPRRGALLRSAALFAAYLFCEIVGIAITAALWLWRAFGGIGAESWTHLHHRLEALWGAALYHAMVRLFALHIEIEDDADLGRGPYLLLPRHVFTGEALIAASLISWSHGLRLRYVMKREILVDPCLDIVGHRLPNAFIDRVGGAAIGRLRELAQDLGARDGILIFPEGTRISAAKRLRILERLRREGDAEGAAYVASLAHVLPPRTGGVFTLLEAAPQADVVICSHAGFDGKIAPTKFLGGALVGQTIHVRFHRIARERIPRQRSAQAAWLRDEWKKLDAWVAQHEAC